MFVMLFVVMERVWQSPATSIGWLWAFLHTTSDSLSMFTFIP